MILIVVGTIGALISAAVTIFVEQRELAPRFATATAAFAAMITVGVIILCRSVFLG